MKRALFLNLMVVGLALFSGAAGCKKKPIGVTVIPGATGGGPTAGGPGRGPGYQAPLTSGPGIDTGALPTGTSPVPILPSNEPRPIGERPSDWENRTKNREILHAQTVYFDLDKSNIKESERAKLNEVADYLKTHSDHDLLVEGNADERGTEGYNLALGERRALAAREYLANLGVSADRIHTVSNGEAKPAVQGHNEEAYSKNRRDEFVVVLPAGQ